MLSVGFEHVSASQKSTYDPRSFRAEGINEATGP